MRIYIAYILYVNFFCFHRISTVCFFVFLADFKYACESDQTLVKAKGFMGDVNVCA